MINLTKLIMLYLATSRHQLPSIYLICWFQIIFKCLRDYHGLSKKKNCFESTVQTSKIMEIFSRGFIFKCTKITKILKRSEIFLSLKTYK